MKESDVTDDIKAGLEKFLVLNPDLDKISLRLALQLAYLAGRKDATSQVMREFDKIYHDE